RCAKHEFKDVGKSTGSDSSPASKSVMMSPRIPLSFEVDGRMLACSCPSQSDGQSIGQELM
ncbi:hypothetical protein PJP07_30365, partial [Mycobacterium kansasii]